MSLENDLAAIEKRLWTGGPEVYRSHLDEECLIAFTEMAGVMSWDAIAETVTEGNRWQSVEMDPRGLLQPTADLAILTYGAKAAGRRRTLRGPGQQRLCASRLRVEDGLPPADADRRLSGAAATRRGSYNQRMPSKASILEPVVTAHLPPAALAAAREYAEVLRRELRGRLRVVRLFGSTVRGEAHEDSDVDVAVVVDGLDRATWCEIVNHSADIGLEHEVHLSPTLFDSETWRLWRQHERRLVLDIEREGIDL